jgi:hypothetical protein
MVAVQSVSETIALHRRLAGEGLADRGGRLDQRRVVHVEVRVREDVRQVRAEEVGGQEDRRARSPALVPTEPGTVQW